MPQRGELSRRGVRCSEALRVHVGLSDHRRGQEADAQHSGLPAGRVEEAAAGACDLERLADAVPGEHVEGNGRVSDRPAEHPVRAEAGAGHP